MCLQVYTVMQISLERSQSTCGTTATDAALSNKLTFDMVLCCVKVVFLGATNIALDLIEYLAVLVELPAVAVYRKAIIINRIESRVHWVLIAERIAPRLIFAHVVCFL